ncbi:MAG: MerR family transcriptional regulator [Deltaproteobacteria bacterium]|nr:MerR family transcriptional regulator [Deltaproteobacteria bacterium]
MALARKQTIPNKLYFRIGEVSDIVGVKPYVLRYWETEFSDVRPTKSKSGQRLYKRRDVELLLQVKQLLYEERYTIDGAKQRLRETGRGADEAPVIPVPRMEGRGTPVPRDEGQLSLTDADDAAEDDPTEMPDVTASEMFKGSMRLRDGLASRKLLTRLKHDLDDILAAIRG